MPQGRRKIPFSGKKKKEQLAERRHRKGKQTHLVTSSTDPDDAEEGCSAVGTSEKLHVQSSRNSRSSRYALQFFKETEKDIQLLKRKAREPLVCLTLKDREISDSYFKTYDFPTRPPWNYSMSKEELDAKENRYFTEYVRKLEEKLSSEQKLLSLFELNLETWRQLWRVLETSDIVLIILDIRYPTMLFPPTLFSYVNDVMKKNVVLILNKVDLVQPALVLAWKHYFLQKYPGIFVSLFTSYDCRKMSTLKIEKRKATPKYNNKCPLPLFKCIKQIVGNDLDLSRWEEKIHQDIAAGEMDPLTVDYPEAVTKPETCCFEDHIKYKDGILTIGCVGFPNVGKSSIINALKGQKVVSVSRTPGHTKYFQTIFLTENVKLCDCPGLVFPSSTPKHLQVIIGSYPIAQLREPYSSIRFIAERIDLPKILSVELPPDYEEWSPFAICEAWALKRNFITAKAARPDMYRAANNILQLVLQGRIVLEFYPQNFVDNQDKWTQHPEFESVQKLFVDHAISSKESETECPNNSEEEGSRDGSDEESSEGNTLANPWTQHPEFESVQKLSVDPEISSKDSETECSNNSEKEGSRDGSDEKSSEPDTLGNRATCGSRFRM